MSKKIKSPVPSELEGVATTDAVDVLSGKVEKCYSSERYEDFQDAVEKIMSRYLKSNVGWAIIVWILSLLGSMLAEKFLHIF
jgi:pheromone shutdown protein TraB